MVSPFVLSEWRSRRHLLNPSRWKEYELHAVGLGWVNKFNFIPDYKERVTHIDPLNLDGLHLCSTVHLIRENGLSEEEVHCLVNSDFRLVRYWETLIVDTFKELKLDRGNLSLIRSAERSGCVFEMVKSKDDFREYYELFRNNRRSQGLGTPRYKYFERVFGNPFYGVFVVKKDGRVVAGLGLVFNGDYACQMNVCRDKGVVGAGDFLTYSVINLLRLWGVRWFDLAGVNPDPKPGSKDEGIRRYKEKWGGEVYGEFVFKRGLF